MDANVAGRQILEENKSLKSLLELDHNFEVKELPQFF
jgi:hypothetical protein